jgi:glycosyltransferase involved in cell wall biosynthesis
MNVWQQQPKKQFYSCALGSTPGQGPKIKVVFLLRSLTIGGSQRQLISLVSRLDPLRFDIVILSLYSGGAFADQLLATGVTTISLGKKGRWDLLRSGARLVALARRLAPDIVHSFSPVTNVVAALLKRTLPKTRIVWGIRGSNVAGRQLDWMEKLNLKLQSRLSSWPDLIILNSYAGREYYLRSGMSADKMLVIPNGIDTDRFKPDSRLRDGQRARWQVKEDSPLVGIVGRLATVKDHPTFLRAAALWARSASEVKFVCIGDGEEHYVQKLRKLGCDLGLQSKIIWTGPILGEMPSAYAGLDICCNSSKTEGSSNSIAEAMACGVPCVVTDVGDSRHIVSDCGVVVAPGDADALAAALSRMGQLIKEQPEIRIRARERIQAKFSVDSLVQQTAEALLKLS